MTPLPAPLWVFRARPVRVVDGDTVDVELDVGFHGRRVERVRLLGVDCPERGQPGWHEATAYVADWLVGAGGRSLGTDAWTLVVETEQSDAFGRYLALVWRVSDGRCLTDDLLDAGLAAPYRARS